MSIVDPDNPTGTWRCAATSTQIVPDPEGDFYMHLNDRYGGPFTEPPPDHPDRVVIVVRPTGVSTQ